MKHEKIDRERLFGPVPDEVHTRLEATLSELEEEPMRKKLKYQPILIIALVLLLCGAAFAAVSWDVREALTRTESDGTQIINEELVQHAQPVNKTFGGDTLRIRVTDAVFDGRSIGAAWTLESLSDEMLYLDVTEAEGSVHWNDGAGSMGGIDMFLLPGQMGQGMMDRRLYDEISGDTLHVGIRYTVLRPIAEMVYVQYPPSGTFEGDRFIVDRDPVGTMAAFEAENSRLSAEGKLVMIGEEGDAPYLDVVFWNEDLSAQFERLGDTATQAEAMVATGKFEYVETVVVAFDLRAEDYTRSLLAKGEIPEAAYDDFTMRIVSAEITPGTLEILVDAIFPDEATAREWVDPHGDSLGMIFLAYDEEGRSNWGTHGGGGAAIREPVEQPDGTWRMQYSISHTQMTHIPQSLTICPVQLIKGENAISMPTQRTLGGGITIEVGGEMP